MLYDYQSSEATDSGQCQNVECPTPVVLTDPVSGSGVAFPFYIRLYSDVPNATIRYTIDGTEPDSLSETYTEPILLASSGVVVRAIAHVEDCEPGAVTVAQFGNSLFPFRFSYACDTPDNGGQWDEWAPNGANDHHWRLVFTLAGATTIKRLELYQLDSSGNWTTGQAWATDSPINPFADSEQDFAVFPLLVFIAAVQQWTDYQSSLGSYGAATHTWDLYGDIVVVASGLFRVDIILDDDTRLSQTINTTCEAVAPPLCPPPATPTATGECSGAASITFTGTVGRPYKIFYSSPLCGIPAFEEVASGTIDVSPKTVLVTGMDAGCEFYFYVSIDEAGCGYRDSATAKAVPLFDPGISVSIDKTVVDPGEEFTVTWTSQHIADVACGGCAAGEILTPFGCMPGNVRASQVTSITSPCGAALYEVSGCNTCGQAVAVAQIEVRCPATCVPQVPNFVTLGTMDCDNILANCTVSNRCGGTIWDYRMYNDGANGCSYTGGAQIGLCITSGICGIQFAGAGTTFYPEIPVENSYWELTVAAGAGIDFTTIWVGRKLVGNGPTGIYTRTGGCATSPATITLS